VLQDNANIARHLALMAARQPTVAALKVPRGRTRSGDIDYLTLSFSELAAEVAAWQADLTTRGVRPADRVLVMVRPGLPLIAAAFALFSIGAVPIVIDPGMGLKSFLACVARSQPRVLLGIPLARVISRVYRKTFRSVQIRVPASGSATSRKSSADFQSAPLQFRQAARGRLEVCATFSGHGRHGGRPPAIVLVLLLLLVLSLVPFRPSALASPSGPSPHSAF
jgi:non-ribosomal peptide synthetase component E (peptide arylation enzyme)